MRVLSQLPPGSLGRASRTAAAPLPDGGFTLVELTLSLSLMVIVLACAYACLSAGFATQKIVEPRVDVIQNGRVAMALLSADLRGACVLPGGTDFLGMQRRIGEVQADNIDFATHNYSPARPQEADFCEVSYFIDMNPQSGQLCLWRRRNPIIALDPLAGGRREEIASGVRGLQFEYFDGFEWYDTWGDLSRQRSQSSQSAPSGYAGNLLGMPEAVRITLLLDAEPGGRTQTKENAEPVPPLVFRAVARLNTAYSSFLSSAGRSDSNPESQPNNPAQPGSGGPP